MDSDNEFEYEMATLTQSLSNLIFLFKERYDKKLREISNYQADILYRLEKIEGESTSLKNSLSSIQLKTDSLDTEDVKSTIAK